MNLPQADLAGSAPLTNRLAFPARPDQHRALCGNDPKAATNQFLCGIEEAGVAARNAQLKQLERNRAAKDDQENQAVMPAVADGKQKAQQRKRADVLEQDNRVRFNCPKLRPEVSRRKRRKSDQGQARPGDRRNQSVQHGQDPHAPRGACGANKKRGQKAQAKPGQQGRHLFAFQTGLT